MWSRPSRFQATVDGFAHPFRSTVDETPAGSIRAVAEFGGDDEAIPPAPENAAHEFLVRVRAVDVSRIQEGDPEVDGPLERFLRFRVVAAAVEGAHAHAAESDGGHLQALGPELTFLHDDGLSDARRGDDVKIRRSRLRTTEPHLS